jgi:hypothetical protein
MKPNEALRSPTKTNEGNESLRRPTKATEHDNGRANAGQQRPTKHNEAQRRPTKTNEGLRRPMKATKAYEDQRRPTQVNEGQRKPTKANASQRRPTKGRRPTLAKLVITRFLSSRFFYAFFSSQFSFISVSFFFYTNYTLSFLYTILFSIIIHVLST